QILVLALDLLPDAVEVLGPPLEDAPDAHFLQALLQGVDDLLELLFPLLPATGDAARELSILLGMKGPERQVLHLPLHGPHAEAMGQRRVNLQRLRGHPALALHRQMPQRDRKST